jgi:hypothetical protein
LAEVGFGDEIRGLKEGLTKSDERTRREAFERAFASAREAAGEDALMPVLDHSPFREAVVNGLLDPTTGVDVQTAADVWKDRLPEQARALRRFFTTLEQCLLADAFWGPILDRYHNAVSGARCSRRYRRTIWTSHRARWCTV